MGKNKNNTHELALKKTFRVEFQILIMNELRQQQQQQPQNKHLDLFN